MDPITVALVAVAIFLLYKLLYARPNNFPPGPRGLPFFGYGLSLPKLHRCLHKCIVIVSEKYGSVVGMYFGFMPVIAVTGYEAVSEVLGRPEFDGRPLRLPAVFPISHKGQGIILADGETHKIQRRFGLRHLRDFGFGKNDMEGMMAEEVTDLVETIKNKSKETKDGGVSIKGLFNIPVINILWFTVAGERYKQSNPKLKELLHAAEGAVQSTSIAHISTVLPLLAKLFPKLTGFTDLQNMMNGMIQFFNESIADHYNTHDPDDQRDFMDAYINQIKQNPKEFTNLHLVSTCRDLFTAGSETSSTFLSFMVLYMIRYPDVQKKVQQEIDDVVGKNKLPSLNDKDNLVYTNAMITEIMRISSIAAMTIPHRATEEAQLKGYTVPKDAVLLLSIYSVHMEKKHWGDPEVFRPERFIDSNGKFKKDDHFIAFGLAKRSCLGEALARRNAFLFTTILLQAFNFKPVPGEKLPNPDDALSEITLHCPSYRFIATPRE